MLLLPDDVKLIHKKFLHQFLYQYNHLFQIKEEKIFDCQALFIIYKNIHNMLFLKMDYHILMHYLINKKIVKIITNFCNDEVCSLKIQELQNDLNLSQLNF